MSGDWDYESKKNDNEETRKYEEIGFEFTESDEVFAVKCRVPFSVIQPGTFVDIVGEEMEDKFFDSMDDSFGKSYFYCRQRKTSSGLMKQKLLNLYLPRHCYHEVICGTIDLPEKMILSYKFSRKVVKADDVILCYDHVYFPVRYDVITFSSTRKRPDACIVDQLLSIVDVFLKSSMGDSRPELVVDFMKNIPSVSEQFHFLPSFSKFAFVLQCVDGHLYDEVYQRYDLSSRSAKKCAELLMLNKKKFQTNSLIKQYVWDITIYPFSVYGKVESASNYEETLKRNCDDWENIINEVEEERRDFKESNTSTIEIANWDY
jgi:hypothetical protein